MSKPQICAWHGGTLKLHRESNFGEVSNDAVPLQTVANTIISDLGMRLAINNLTLGVAAHSPRSAAEAAPSKAKRGGARNQANRESTALTPSQVQNLLAAAEHAKAIGLPFTRMITIHWESAGIPPEKMAKATGRFLDLLSKALARHGSRTAWLWVHESGKHKGSHCHLLVHVPAIKVPVIVRLQKRWLRSITGNPYRARVIYSRPIGGRVGQERTNPDVHAVNLAEALSYVLKGADSAATDKFGLTRLEPSGTIIGKRCGTSQNIGAKARKAKE